VYKKTDFHTFCKWFSSFVFESFISSVRLANASFAALHCSLKSSEVSWRTLSIKDLRLIDAIRSRSARTMLSCVN